MCFTNDEPSPDFRLMFKPLAKCMRPISIANGLDLFYPEVSLDEVLGLMAFFDEVFVPLRYLNDQIFLAIRDALAGKSGFQAQAGGFIKLIVFVIRRVVASFEAFFYDDVARGAGADPSAGMFHINAISQGDVQ